MHIKINLFSLTSYLSQNFRLSCTTKLFLADDNHLTQMRTLKFACHFCGVLYNNFALSDCEAHINDMSN